MKKRDFFFFFAHYEKDSLVQKSAGEILFDLIDIRKNDDVLDLGCGTGHLTTKIREMTDGRVTGVDASEGMIEKAREEFGHLDIKFEACPAGEMKYAGCFDAIFCNSAFQWFKQPEQVLDVCFNALRKNGRMAIQAPARKLYSPNFISAIENVKKDARTKETFAHFDQPWFFLDTSNEYKDLFQKSGFEVLHSNIDRVESSYIPDEVFKIFDSGASAGYLNQEYFDVPITEEFVHNFETIVKESFNAQAGKDGKVDLVFFRIYLLARKN